MQAIRREALRLMGAGVAGSVLSGGAGKSFAGPPASYVDEYCYCSDILVSATPDAALNVIATGENHSRWAVSVMRETSPGLWLGRSTFTGKNSPYLRYKVDPQRYTVDYVAGGATDPVEAMHIENWARVVSGKLLGYPDGTSLIALYQTRHANAKLDAFLDGRSSHAAEMYRIKLVAERGAAASTNALLTGEYLAAYTALVTAPVDGLFDFISDGMIYGKYTWGRSPRTKVGTDTFQCKPDFGGPDILVRYDVDRERKTVDYYTGEKPETMMLTQSARVFPGPAFDYDANAALVTFTRWRRAGQSNVDWDRAVANQVEEARMTKSNLENGVRG